MYLIKRAVLLALTGCLMLLLGWSTESRAVAQTDTLPGAVEGAFTPIPLTLWEDENDADRNIAAWDLCDELSWVPFHNGDVLYYSPFVGEQGEMYYRTIDVSTMQVSQVQFPQVFGEENRLRITWGEDYCHVLTNSAVYTFDKELALVRRTPWPTALRSLMDRWADEQNVDRAEWIWDSWDVNPSGTVIVYKDISSWILENLEEPKFGEEYFTSIGELAVKDADNKFISVCALQPDAVPLRILPCITRPAVDYFVKEEYGAPRFVGDDRIFVKNWGWEWVNYWEVWDLQGRRLFHSVAVELWDYDLYPRQRQAEDAHGALMHNPESLAFSSTFYFDYQTLQQERLPLLSHPPYNGDWVFCAVEGRTCIFAMAAEGTSGQAERIDFYRYSFDTQVVEPLPLTLHGVKLAQAALAPGGRIVFLYGDDEWEPQYAGVFQCP